MRFDTKISIAVRADLAQWQKLNVTAFLASGIAAANPDIIGKPYEDAAGNSYLELFRQPALIYGCEPADLTTIHTRALTRAPRPQAQANPAPRPQAQANPTLRMAVYTMDMFGTDNDDDNRAVVRSATELDLAGLALYGPRNLVDKVFKGASLHP
jgi:hypothetical protein